MNPLVYSALGMIIMLLTVIASKLNQIIDLLK